MSEDTQPAEPAKDQLAEPSKIGTRMFEQAMDSLLAMHPEIREAEEAVMDTCVAVIFAGLAQVVKSYEEDVERFPAMRDMFFTTAVGNLTRAASRAFEFIVNPGPGEAELEDAIDAQGIEAMGEPGHDVIEQERAGDYEAMHANEPEHDEEGDPS